MAIAYNLDMATSFTKEQVADEVLDSGRNIGIFDTSVQVEQLLEKGALASLGTWIRVYEPRIRPWNPVAADFGFTPTVSIVFRLNKEDRMSEQEDDMIRLVSRLLDRVPGDLLLHWDYEHIWLLRRNNDLSVSEDPDLWPPQRLTLLAQPYHRASHHFSEE
ncbi:hypothetical protein FNH05_08045 [Amycolatopsis rhizosphaerae]|uniref:Uncharacterized protein n=1 Tax=Amycolatopsis rhizosphaerae TaxID=2053003 RepID=A0A558D6Q5_9PSEU|nr:SitI3 family protein [Amycolatopsis rhizosphaerae]TVT56695.1 hypothetical protein FNH05_08045 [Amycolatopsis rhizosphaerae]